MKIRCYNFSENQLKLNFEEYFDKIKIQKLESKQLSEVCADYEVISICFNKMKNDIVLNISKETSIVGLIIETNNGISSFLLQRTITTTNNYLKNENIYATIRRKQ
jgi:hypothetical protein